MPHVIADLSPSLDGFIAGEGVSVERPFGGAELALHIAPLLLAPDPPSSREKATWVAPPLS